MRNEPYEFEALAKYNSECARGIVHTEEYDKKMVSEQARFNEGLREKLLAQGGEDHGDFWLVPSRAKPLYDLVREAVEVRHKRRGL